jgi:hypothetical protein
VVALAPRQVDGTETLDAPCLDAGVTSPRMMRS